MKILSTLLPLPKKQVLSVTVNQKLKSVMSALSRHKDTRRERNKKIKVKTISNENNSEMDTNEEIAKALVKTKNAKKREVQNFNNLSNIIIRHKIKEKIDMILIREKKFTCS